MIVGHIGGGATPPYEIKQSLRFRGAPYLSRTHTAGDRTKWTWSARVKRGKLGTAYMPLFSANVAGGDILWFDGSDILQLWQAGVGSRVSTATAFRDVASHYHIVLAVDTTQALAIDRFKIYVNGAQVTVTNPVATAQNTQLTINAASQHVIGGWPTGAWYFDGCMSDINFVDGQALTAASFGQSNPATGAWEPKKYTGTYGTNGFYLPFNDGSNLTNLCLDRSGNGNNWTATGVSLTAGANYDWLLDTPTNNFANVMATDANTTTISEGGVKVSAAGLYSASRSSIRVSSGKWYWEGTYVSGANNNAMFGVCDSSVPITSANWTTANAWVYNGLGGNKYTNSASSAYGAAYTANDVIGVALDMDAGTVAFYKNGVSQGVAYSTLSGKTISPTLGDPGGGPHVFTYNFGQAPLSSGATFYSAAGGYFKYAPPAGFKALCSANIPDVAMLTSGAFTGNASADGPFVYLNGVPASMTIDGNAVTWGTHADKLSNGFKIRTASSPYNDASSNSYVVTVAGSKFKYANAQVNS